ncbi:MAG: chromosome segregation protein SMC [Bacteroidetes bacterium]|nr:chromosome segregation protein SMC [Bacteroidota bacterium]
MRLTKLEIQGFKSFADSVRLNFDAGITGIVGPNGCGKSNVVDSIRWVLGETKTRNLRSEKMEDVIFNGTSRRKRANVAEVAITFENTRNILPTEYTTVTVTRRYFRDGDSEYLINGVPCRLKDIHSLFMDTGIGPDSYAIIELAMVEDLIKDKANARRQLFEEAAGVSRYKLRKKETLGKLDEVTHNLERVEDILFEIEKNLKSLEKQAKRAEQYLNLRAQYRHASCQLAWLRIRHLLENLGTLETRDRELADKATSLQSASAQHDARRQDLAADIDKQEKELGKEQKTYNTHVEKIRKLERDKEVRNERLKYLQQTEEEQAKQLEQNRQKTDLNEKNISRLEQQVEDAERELGKQEKAVHHLETQVQTLQEQNKTRKAELDTHALQLREQETQLQKLIREKEMREIQVQGLEGQLRQTEEDTQSRTAEISTFQARIDALAQEVHALQQQVEALENQKTQLEEALNQNRLQAEQLRDELATSRRTLDARQNEYNLTKGLVDSLEGFPESLRWLKQNVDVTREAPLVGDVFYISDAYKVALENYLEPWMNHYVVFSRAEAARAVSMLKDSSKGRAQFFILEEVKAHIRRQKPAAAYKAKEGISILPVLEQVEYSEEYTELAQYLFDGVYLTETDPTQAEIPEGVTLIRTNGSMVSRKLSLAGGSVGLFEGKRLGRAKNLDKLEQAIEKLEKKLEQQEKQKKELDSEQERIKTQLPGDALHQARRQLTQKQQELEVVKAKAEEYQALIQKTGLRKEEIVRSIEELHAQITALLPQLEAHKTELEECYRQQTLLTEHWQQLNDNYTLQNQVFNQQNIAFHTAKNQFHNLQKELEQEKDRKHILATQQEQFRRQLEDAREQIKYLVDNNLSNDDEMVALYDQKQAMESHLTFLEDRLANTKTSMQHAERAAREERMNGQQIMETRAVLKDQMTELRLQQSSVMERMQVEWNITLEDLDPETLFGTTQPEMTVEEADDTVIRLRERYTKFGEVNTTAPEAYNEIKERHDFILEQKTDLLGAKDDLLRTIEEIDITAREQFMAAFTTIRENFVKVFRTLFTVEDDCDIMLVNPEDPLESPIEVVARPKGKRPSNISQLSGGEKTLTAISLLFAIYLLKPAPFCIFDEVDAPLDDANIDKFNNILQEFSSESQFIVVTHNKRTMVKTQVMYGVTMEETGVSRVLPVDLQTLNLQPA